MQVQHLYGLKISQEIVNTKKIKKLSIYLKNINSKAILVRPDRFILGSANSNHEINLLLKKYSEILR